MRKLIELGAATVALAGLSVAIYIRSQNRTVCEIDYQDLDPLSSLHVEPGTEIEFTSDPPTSGPHLDKENLEGVLYDGFDQLELVTALERGKVVVEFRPDLQPPDVDLLTLVSPGTVLVPAASDFPHAIRARAWRTLFTCEQIQQTELEGFIARHRAPSAAADH